MKKLILALTLFTSLAFAQDISDLIKEFNRRESIKFKPAQGATINFLVALKFPIDDITSIELRGNDFFIKNRSNLTCFGNISEQTFRCRNRLGHLSQSIGEMNPAPQDSTSGATEIEFLRRESLPLTETEKNVVEFLKTTLKFPVGNIVKIELLGDASVSFFIEDINNLVCFGNIEGEILRCKNEIGITSVTFVGDSD